jgi:hypothetical protein
VVQETALVLQELILLDVDVIVALVGKEDFDIEVVDEHSV